MAILVLDIGGSAVKFGIYARDKWLLLNQFDTPTTRTVFYHTILTIIEDFPPDTTLTGVAVSCPGEVDETSGEVRGFSFVPFIHLGAFQKELTEVVGVPVSMMNDAQCAALAEMTAGIGVGSQNPLFVIIGSGLGLAVIKHGTVLTETANKIDEIEQLVATAVKDYNNAKVSPVRIGKRVSIKKWHWPSTIKGKDVFQLAQKNDPIAVKEISRMYQSLAEVLLLLASAFQPDFIGIGGGVSNQPELLPQLEQEMQTLITHNSPLLAIYHTLFPSEKPLSKPPLVKVCAFKSEANLVGALTHFNQRFPI